MPRTRSILKRQYDAEDRHAETEARKAAEKPSITPTRPKLSACAWPRWHIEFWVRGERYEEGPYCITEIADTAEEAATQFAYRYRTWPLTRARLVAHEWLDEAANMPRRRALRPFVAIALAPLAQLEEAAGLGPACSGSDSPGVHQSNAGREPSDKRGTPVTAVTDEGRDAVKHIPAL